MSDRVERSGQVTEKPCKLIPPQAGARCPHPAKPGGDATRRLGDSQDRSHTGLSKHMLQEKACGDHSIISPPMVSIPPLRRHPAKGCLVNSIQARVQGFYFLILNMGHWSQCGSSCTRKAEAGASLGYVVRHCLKRRKGERGGEEEGERERERKDAGEAKMNYERVSGGELKRLRWKSCGNDKDLHSLHPLG